MSIHKGKFCNETPQLESITGGGSNKELHHIYWKRPIHKPLHVLCFKVYEYNQSMRTPSHDTVCINDVLAHLSAQYQSTLY